MKYLMILLVCLALALPGCATTSTTSTPQTALTQVQTASMQSLLAMGTILRACPGTMDALYAAGKVTKEQYNQVTVIYNRALASYSLTVEALKTVMRTGEDPNQATAYITALSTFITDNGNLNNLVVAMGGVK